MAAASGRGAHADHSWDNCGGVGRYGDILSCVPGWGLVPLSSWHRLLVCHWGAQPQLGMAGDTQKGPALDVAERKRYWASPGWGQCFLPPASPSKNAPDLRQEMRLHTGLQTSCSLADAAALDLHLGLTLGLQPA